MEAGQAYLALPAIRAGANKVGAEDLVRACMLDAKELEVRKQFLDSILDRCATESPSVHSLETTACH